VSRNAASGDALSQSSASGDAPKVFVSIDLEGCTGVVTEDQTEPGRPAWEGARRLMRADLDAVIDGCRAGGAGEIVVCDAHDRGANLSAADLPSGVRLVRGSPPPLGMMAGIDESFDAALFVGYHARAGTTGAVLDHTYTYRVFRVRVDDMTEAGEFAVNTALAGSFGVPVVFVSGDEAAVAEARELLPGVTGVAVKTGRTRTSARLLSPDHTRTLLRDGAQRALRAVSLPAARPAALSWDERSLRVVFTRSDFADAAAVCPGVERVDARTIRLESPRFLSTFTTFVAALRLAAKVT
jgi:D-amino peptidase